MEAKYKERLLQVCRVLRELPPEKRFSLSVWHNCGTVACAVGWAETDPWFKKRGLRLIKDDVLDDYKLPFYDGDEGSLAVKRFFGLDDEEDKLFYSCGYTRRTRKDVIRRIEAFVKDG